MAENGMEHIGHFYETGKLLNGTYYFDPPLIEPEIRELHDLFGHIKGNKVISSSITSKFHLKNNPNLLWLDVAHNEIVGWQNTDEADDEDGNGEYALDNLESIKRWCHNNSCYEPFRDGRLFLNDLPNTEDIFNQLNQLEGSRKLIKNVLTEFKKTI
jgi:hypothetical protein